MLNSDTAPMFNKLLKVEHLELPISENKHILQYECCSIYGRELSATMQFTKKTHDVFITSCCLL